MVTTEALGRAPAPYLASVILGGGAVAMAGAEPQRQELLPALASGDLHLAFAHAEAQARYDLEDVAATARTEGGGFVLDGAKSVVLNADSAQMPNT